MKESTPPETTDSESAFTYTVFAGLGSNIDPEANLKKSLRLLKEEDQLTLERISSVYETQPVGMSDDTRNFHNLSIRARCKHSSDNLKDYFRQLEAKCGRERSQTDKYNSRVIDIDILFYDPSPAGFEPHPQIFQEAFVIYPLCDIMDPDNYEILPEERSIWKKQSDQSIINGKVQYDWPEDLREESPRS